MAGTGHKDRMRAKTKQRCPLPKQAHLIQHYPGPDNPALPIAQYEFMSQPTSTPKPPDYAVVFTSLRSPADPEGYEATTNRMVELAREQPGYLGVESARGDDGLGITVSYWSSLEAIRNWREHAEHTLAQEQGRAKWYSRYALRICRVERAWEFEAKSI